MPDPVSKCKIKTKDKTKLTKTAMATMKPNQKEQARGRIIRIKMWSIIV
jgi:hypothetical protein